MNLEQIAKSIESYPNALRTLLSPLSRDVLTVKDEGGWCVLEIIGHMIEGDKRAFRGRVAAIVRGDAEIASVSPSAGMDQVNYAERDLDEVLDEMARDRMISAEFIRSLTAADLEKSAIYPKYGVFKAGDFIYEWPYHDQDHLQQILALTKASYLPQMSDTMREALSQ